MTVHQFPNRRPYVPTADEREAIALPNVTLGVWPQAPEPARIRPRQALAIFALGVLAGCAVVWVAMQ